MDYLGYFNLTSEPFSNAPLSRFYYASRQHSDALKRLHYAASSMKGLAILVGDIGLGKTTLARRMLESLPEEEYEAAMLVIVHAGITPNWLLKRIAIQLGVESPADDKLAILSQLYRRLVQIYASGRKAVVLIDEAQMLATRELMEEFRGLLNLEVPDRKLLSFIFFGLPEIERNLRLDPPLAQRIAMRYRLKPLGEEDTAAYIRHRLDLAGAEGREIFVPEAVSEVFKLTSGVPRLVNTLCDNLLLELFFAQERKARPALVQEVAENLGIDGEPLEELSEVPLAPELPAVEGGPGHDAIAVIDRDSLETTVPDAASETVAGTAEMTAAAGTNLEPSRADSDAIRALPEHAVSTDEEVAEDQGPPVSGMQTQEDNNVDIDDPLAFLETVGAPDLPGSSRSWEADEPPPTQVTDGPPADPDELVERYREQLAMARAAARSAAGEDIGEEDLELEDEVFGEPEQERAESPSVAVDIEGEGMGTTADELDISADVITLDEPVGGGPAVDGEGQVELSDELVVHDDAVEMEPDEVLLTEVAEAGVSANDDSATRPEGASSASSWEPPAWEPPEWEAPSWQDDSDGAAEHSDASQTEAAPTSVTTPIEPPAPERAQAPASESNSAVPKSAAQPQTAPQAPSYDSAAKAGGDQQPKKRSTVDLTEIDALLADLNLDRKK